MRAPLVRGRDFTGDDVAGAPGVAIVSDAAARQLWPGRDPIGQPLRLPLAPDEGWSVAPTDPPTFAAALVFLLAVAGLASLLPTRKAIGLNPTVALRE